MDYYINSENLVYTGEMNPLDRELTQEESLLVERGFGYEIQGGKVVDVSQTPEYCAQMSSNEKQIQIKEIQMQIDELDKKRIRAIAEPQLKDPISGKTWLEFYTEQIIQLRAKI